MRKSIRRFVQLSVEVLPIAEPIYEFGAFIVAGQEKIADVRSFFPGKQFYGADIREGRGVDVILDLHRIDLPDESVGTVVVLDTLEHVEYCREAIDEVFRILKPNGIFILSSVMNFPIHDYPSDYWRFTPQGFRSLLQSFETAYVDYEGDDKFPHTVIAVAVKGSLPQTQIDAYKKMILQWKKEQNTLTQRIKKIVRYVTPPLIVEGWYALRKRINRII